MLKIFEPKKSRDRRLMEEQLQRLYVEKTSRIEEICKLGGQLPSWMPATNSVPDQRRYNDILHGTVEDLRCKKLPFLLPSMCFDCHTALSSPLHVYHSHSLDADCDCTVPSSTN